MVGLSGRDADRFEFGMVLCVGLDGVGEWFGQSSDEQRGEFDRCHFPAVSLSI